MKELRCSDYKIDPICPACAVPRITDHKRRLIRRPTCWLTIYPSEIKKLQTNAHVKNYIIDRSAAKYGNKETARFISLTINIFFPEYIDLLNKILVLS